MDTRQETRSFGTAIDRQLRTWEIDPASFDAMARIFSRNLAREYDRGSLGSAGSAHRGWKAIGWLDPAIVWWVLRGSRIGSPRPGPLDPRFRDIRPSHTTCVPSVGLEAWASDVVARLGENVDGLDDDTAGPTVAGPTDLDVIGLLRDAEWCLDASWPEERRLVGCLVRSLICIDAGPLRSGSDLIAFGAIFVNPRKVRSTLDLVEVLLHETAHHELFLRNVFTPYLKNPKELTHHPLRPDARPMAGALHAAVALGRMAMGLRKVAETWPSTDVDARATRCKALLATTMNALEAAEWTVEGQAFYESIREWAA
jgi:hypothetical protein